MWMTVYFSEDTEVGRRSLKMHPGSNDSITMRRIRLFFIMMSLCCLAIGCSDPKPAPEQTPSPTVMITSVPTLTPEPTAALTPTPELEHESEDFGESDNSDKSDQSGNPGNSDEYIFICTTSEGDPLPGVRVQVCTDEVCMMQTSGEDGRIIFDGEPQQYSIHVYS